MRSKEFALSFKRLPTDLAAAREKKNNHTGRHQAASGLV